MPACNNPCREAAAAFRIGELGSAHCEAVRVWKIKYSRSLDQFSNSVEKPYSRGRGHGMASHCITVARLDVFDRVVFLRS